MRTRAALGGHTGAAPDIIALALEAMGSAVLLLAGRVGATLVLEHHIGAWPGPC
jgi:hypothetical protein